MTTTDQAAACPAATLNDPLTRLLGAVVDVYAHNDPPRATLREVAIAAGIDTSVAHRHLRRLESLGLIAGLGTNGGLHPTVAIVAASPW